MVIRIVGVMIIVVVVVLVVVVVAACARRQGALREMGGAPRNLAPRNHFWCGLSNHQAATAYMGTCQAEFH